jgi:hypothetical protein
MGGDDSLLEGAAVGTSLVALDKYSHVEFATTTDPAPKVPSRTRVSSRPGARLVVRRLPPVIIPFESFLSLIDCAE